MSNLIDDLRRDQEESLKMSKQNIQEKVEILKREIPLRESIKKNSYLLSHHKISEEELDREINIYKMLLDYWKSRRATHYTGVRCGTQDNWPLCTMRSYG